MRSSRSQAGWLGSPSTVTLRPVSGGGQGGGSTTRRAALNTGGSTTRRGASSASALLAASLLLLLVLLAACLPSASASLYANGAGYSLNGALLLPGVSIGGLDVGPTLHRLLAAMRDAELRLDAQQRRIDGLQADNGGLRANLTLAVERVRQLEALNGNTTDIFAGIVRDSTRLDVLQANADALDTTVRGQTALLTALRGSNTTLFNSVATLLGADAQLATRLASVNSSLALRLSLAEQLTAGSSPLVARALSLTSDSAAHGASLDSLVGSIALWSGLTTSLPANWALCNGQLGTPDLRNKFVVGSGVTFPHKTGGGSATATPSVTVAGTALSVAQMPAHDHGGQTGVGVPEGASNPSRDFNGANTGTPVIQYATLPGGQGFNKFLDHNHYISSQGLGATHMHTATATPISTVPPWYALAYIMRLA